MKSLYYILPFFIFFQSGFSQNEPKRLDHKHIPVIFTDQSRLRATPSLQGKILAELNANTTVINNRSEHIHVKQAVINNRIGYWIPVIYNGTNGYVWENTLADYKVELKDANTRILCKQEEDSLFFSVFKENIHIYSQGFKKQHDVDYYKLKHYGKTYFSNHADVITWEYDDKHMLFLYSNNSIKHYIPKSDVLTTRVQSSHKADSIMLIANHINIRSDADINSAIVTNVDFNTPLRYLNEEIRGKINDKHGVWYKVSTPSDSGYVWSDFVMFPVMKIPSLLDPTLTFLQSPNRLIALKHDSILAVYSGYIGYDNVYSKGNMGFSTIEVLGAKQIGESCGTFSGDQFFCWDGTSFFPCGSTGGMGDGPYYEDQITLFPSEINDGTQYIHQRFVSGEYIPISNSNQEREEFDFAIYSSQILKYNGDTLEIIRDYINDDPIVEAFMQKQFNTSKIPEILLKTDLNADSKNDLVFMYNGLHFALSDENGDLKLRSSNTNIETYISRANIETYNDGVAVSIIKKSTADDPYGNSGLRRIEFKFDKTLNDLVVSRTIEGEYEYTEEPLNIQYFKKKKITLEEIW